MTDCSGKGFRYPAYEFIEWPFHLFDADTHNPLNIVPLPNPYGCISAHKIGFMGDVMPLRSGKPVTVDEPVRALLRTFDAVVCNLEAPIVEDAAYEGAVKGLRLAFSKQTATWALDALGTDPTRTYVSLGNNHANDYGAQQFRHTVRFLRDRGHPIIGCSDSMLGVNELHVGGSKIGLVGWTYWLNDEWTDPCREFRPTLRGDVDGVDFHRVKLERKLDCLVTFTHWGYEFKHFPRDPFDKVAERLAHAGVDVNVGGHPHVVSPLSRVGETSAFVHYSIGDFSGLHEPWHTRLGSVLGLSIGKNAQGGIELGFERTPVYRDKRDADERVVFLDALPDHRRRECEERFALVTPAAR